MEYLNKYDNSYYIDQKNSSTVINFYNIVTYYEEQFIVKLSVLFKQRKQIQIQQYTMQKQSTDKKRRKKRKKDKKKKKEKKERKEREEKKEKKKRKKEKKEKKEKKRKKRKKRKERKKRKKRR